MLKLELCKWCSAATWCILTKRGPMCRGCHVVAFFGGILYKPLGFRLLGWQEKFIRELYGTVDAETGARVYWQAYAELPKKQGKSFLAGGLPLYHLTMEGVDRAEAYGCAASKDQAGIVFRSAAHMARNNAYLKEHLKILDSTKRIVRRDGGGMYAVLSADGDIQDGVEPSLVVIDELHRWKTAKAHTLWDVVTKGTISRQESMRLVITTAGDVHESALCYREHERARRILSGAEKSGRTYCVIYTADERRIKDEPDYWMSREARVLANPSHEDNGGFLKDERIAAEIENGKASFLRYHLNIWGQREDRWLQPGEWAKGNQETRSLLGRSCYIGLDLSTTTDFTAMVMVFPDKTDGSYDVLPFFWVPQGRVVDLEKKLHVPLRRWVDAGLLQVTAGDVVDYEAVEEKIRWAVEDFSVQEICYDPWNATDLVTRLINAGNNCVKIPQTLVHLSAPMKHIHRKLLEGKLRHGGHEVMAWHAESVVTRTDGNGNIAPKKPDLGKDAHRIDGFAAMLTAMCRGMIPETTWNYEVVTI